MTAPADLLPRLKRSFLFKGANPEAVQAIAAACHVRRAAKGAMLFAAGDEAHSFFFLIEGWVKLFRLSQSGEESIINVVAPGETFAEIAVFGKMGGRYPVNAEAVEDVMVLDIPRGVFIEKIKQDSDFALSLLAAIAMRQRHLVQQIEQVSARSAPQRIGTFLLKLCPQPLSRTAVTVNLPYDKSLISARLNIKPETFSRALAKLRDVGVETHGKQATLAKPAALCDFCECDPMDLFS